MRVVTSERESRRAIERVEERVVGLADLLGVSLSSGARAGVKEVEDEEVVDRGTSHFDEASTRESGLEIDWIWARVA